MPPLEIPPGTRYLIIQCAPNGPDTKTETHWDDAQGMDAATALAMMDAARPVLAQQAAEEQMRVARLRLMGPLPPAVDLVPENGAPKTSTAGKNGKP